MGGRLPDPVTWAQNPEICRYLKRLRDLWQGGDIEGPIGRYIESEKASLSDFMTELNEFKVPPHPVCFPIARVTACR